MIDTNLEEHYLRALTRFGIQDRVEIRAASKDEPVGMRVSGEKAVWCYDDRSAYDEATENAAQLSMALRVHRQLCGMSGDDPTGGRWLAAFHRLTNPVRTAWGVAHIKECCGEETATKEVALNRMLLDQYGADCRKTEQLFLQLTLVASVVALGVDVDVQFSSSGYSRQWARIWDETRRLAAMDPDPALLCALADAAEAPYSVRLDAEGEFVFKERP